MLGTILEKLSGQLSKGAFLSAFLPLLACVAGNVVLLAAINGAFRTWLAAHRSDAELISLAIIIFLVASLIFGAINTKLREIMEGRYWPSIFRRSFTRAESLRLEALNKEYRALSANKRRLRQAAKWTKVLLDARDSMPKANTTSKYQPTGPAGRMVRNLAQMRLCGDVIPAVRLETTTSLLEAELRANPLTSELDDAQYSLNEIFRYSAGKVDQEMIRVFNERRFSFPDQILASTAMGNIALSIRSYTLSRYQLDIERCWSRLQKVMQGEAFYSILQDAKTQLDFVVSLFWLSLASTVAWLIALSALGHSLKLYLCIAVLGSGAVWIAYQLALQNYRAFADLMRSAVDTYRLKLLKELQLRVPSGSAEEALLWQAVQDRMDYGKDFNLGYRAGE